MKILSKIKHQNIEVFPAWYYKFLAGKIARRVNRMNGILIFTTCKELVPFIKNNKVVYIIDAIYSSLINYYYFNVSEREQKIFLELQDKSIKNSYRIIASSDWAKNEVISRYKFNPDYVKVCCFGANLDLNYKISNKEFSSPISFLFCGVNASRKRVNLAIDLINYLSEKCGVKCFLNIVGLNGVSTENIKYLGRIDKNEKDGLSILNDIYNKSHILVLPSRAECSAIAFSEAMMYGIPMISCNTGGVSSYVQNDINGFCVDLDKDFVGEASKWVMTLDRFKYKFYSDNCLKLSKEKYNWDFWAETVHNYLNKN